MWTRLTVACAVIALVGYLVADSVPNQGLAAEAFAAGAVLTMLADSMMPEAFENGGNTVGPIVALSWLSPSPSCSNTSVPRGAVGDVSYTSGSVPRSAHFVAAKASESSTEPAAVHALQRLVVNEPSARPGTRSSVCGAPRASPGGSASCATAHRPSALARPSGA
jgi:hypothetical protein